VDPAELEIIAQARTVRFHQKINDLKKLRSARQKL
jgi:hypothetical protein